MKRKEVFVGNQAFDLGIEGFADTVANRDGKLTTLELEVGNTIFQVGYIDNEKAVCLNWWGETSARNINWTRFVFLRLRRPFVKTVTAFTYAIEGA